MPTAARLVAAISLALVALGVSVMVMARMTEITNFGWFVQVNLGLGLVIGWMLMGPQARPGLAATLNNGITSAVVLTVCALAVQGGYEMFRLALNRRYHGLGEAIGGIVRNMIDYAQVLANPEIPAALLLGGLLAAAATRFAARMWR